MKLFELMHNIGYEWDETEHEFQLARAPTDYAVRALLNRNKNSEVLQAHYNNTHAAFAIKMGNGQPAMFITYSLKMEMTDKVMMFGRVQNVRDFCYYLEQVKSEPVVIHTGEWDTHVLASKLED